ncbi:MAG: hypothetical protein LBC85_08170, partial [Fibromonadaceae bacterium]|nr:hypothetical protein [Fibromonadaceae bacterium]
ISKKARKENIFILPGVELSVNDGANGVHTLIVFDPDDWLVDGNDYINQFITANFAGKHNFDNANGRSNHNLQATLELLDKFDKNHFVIMAHVEQSCGLLSEFDGGRIIELGKNPLFKGEHCLIKVGDFNFEAIKYALTDPHRTRLNESPKTTNSYIKSISFEGGLLDGKQISFSPELNNLIGIRGSGKSSLLEILRYALNIPLSAQAVDKDYKNGLIKYVLKSGGKVVVEIVDEHDKTYTIERVFGEKEDIYKDGELQHEITLDAILRQPIYFGQKDLSNKDSNFENDLINKLIGKKLNDINSKVEEQKNVIFRIINELKALDNLSDIKKETEIAQNNAEHKLQLFKEKGIAEKMQIQTAFDTDISKLNTYNEYVNNYVSELNTLIHNYEYLSSQSLQSEINRDIFEEAMQQVGLLKIEFDKLKTVVANLLRINTNLLNISSKVLMKKEESKEEFAQIKREINIPELNPDDFIKLNRILETSKLKLIEIGKSENKRKDLDKQLSNALVLLDKLWLEKFNIIQKDVEKINNSGTKLFIEIEYKGQRDKFLSKLQESFRGSGIRVTSFENIRDKYTDFIQIYKDDFKEINNILNENQSNDFKKQFFKDLYDLLIFKVENKITIKFNDKPLGEHSLGQRASALILFLLSQKENDILIIDQPEDDLDNQTIYNDVIKEIKQLKGQMQFIFATHNANIPVLGDSEMVVACQYIPDTEIKIENGSIDCRSVQEKIIGIMEGGKEAFNVRKNIYKIWEAGKL